MRKEIENLRGWFLGVSKDNKEDFDNFVDFIAVEISYRFFGCLKFKVWRKRLINRLIGGMV